MINHSYQLRFRLAVAGPAVALFAACSSAGDFGGLGSSSIPGGEDQTETASRQESSSDSSHTDDENEKADIPVQVAGAFLTCAFMDGKDDFLATTAASPEGTVGIGCGLFKSEDKKAAPKLIGLGDLKVRLRILTGKDKYVDVASNLLRQPAGLHTISELPAKYLASTIEIKVQDVGTKVAIFRKAIPSVRSFGARTAFDIVDDMTLQGLQLSGNGDVIPAPAPAAAVRDNSWYESLAITLKVTADAYKAYDDAKQAKDEKGLDIYQVPRSAATSNAASPKSPSDDSPELREAAAISRSTSDTGAKGSAKK